MSCASNTSPILGTISLVAWLFAQIPQQIENYNNKSVDGISLHFLCLWFLGDAFNLMGCLLTNQLAFQVILSLYFLLNDLILFSQWYYYSFHYETIDGMEVSLSVPKAIKSKQALLATALHIAPSVASSTLSSSLEQSSWAQKLGALLSWVCTLLYLSSRVPQLYRNWQRKSVEGISPLLFVAAILGNVTYSASILTSCEIKDDGFLQREMPFILGSLGTVVFDVCYFYQKRIYRSLNRGV